MVVAVVAAVVLAVGVIARRAVVEVAVAPVVVLMAEVEVAVGVVVEVLICLRAGVDVKIL